MNILLIAQHIFPMQTPRAHRTTELALELARQNHKVTVYAVLGKYNYKKFEKKNNVIIKGIPIKYELNPYSSDGYKKRNIIDKLLSKILGRLFEFPNIEFKYVIKNIIKKESQTDVLISIANPHQIHWGCANAKKKLKADFPKTWIADCGDPFMKNNTTNDHLLKYEKDEKEFCSMCDYITVPFDGAINAYYPEFREKIKVIPQGFKFDTKRSINIPKNKIITFAYAGTFLEDIRNPKKFFDYLCKIDFDFRFIVFTPFTKLIEPYIKKLDDKLIIKDLVPRLDMIKFLGKMDFLVNIENKNASSQLPSKLIDYGIANRPILSVHPEFLNIKVINQFLGRNYLNQYKIENLEKYNITNVAKSFLNLVQIP